MFSCLLNPFFPFHLSPFIDMDIDSDCFPCMPISNAIQLNHLNIGQSNSISAPRRPSVTSSSSTGSSSGLIAQSNSNKSLTLAALLNSNISSPSSLSNSSSSSSSNHPSNELVSPGLPPTPPGSNSGSDCEMSSGKNIFPNNLSINNNNFSPTSSLSLPTLTRGGSGGGRKCKSSNSILCNTSPTNGSNETASQVTSSSSFPSTTSPIYSAR